MDILGLNPGGTFTIYHSVLKIALNYTKRALLKKELSSLYVYIQLAKERYTPLQHKPYVNEVTSTEHNLS